MTVSNPTREEIAARAYRIWEAEGRPEGRALAHWLEAEDELAVGPTYVRPAGREDMDMAPATWSRTDEESDESFPASDPPGTD